MIKFKEWMKTRVVEDEEQMAASITQQQETPEQKAAKIRAMGNQTMKSGKPLLPPGYADKAANDVAPIPSARRSATFKPAITPEEEIQSRIALNKRRQQEGI